MATERVLNEPRAFAGAVDGAHGVVEWGAAVRAAAGQVHCGDELVASRLSRDGAGGVVGVLFAAIDGLGHGEHAAVAARAARACIEEHVAQQPRIALRDVVTACHVALKGTRGVVMTLARVERVERGPQLTWLAIGNVDGALFSSTRPRESVMQRAGVVGQRLPALLDGTLPLSDGDVLVLATDGVALRVPAAAGSASNAWLAGAPADVSRALLEQHGKHDDDALVLVARYRSSS